MSTFANEIDDRPTILPALEMVKTEIGQFTSSETATEQYGNDRSIALSFEGFDIGRLPEVPSFCSGQPISQPNTEFLHTLYPSDAGGEFWAE